MQLFAALSVVSLSILPLPAHAAVIDSTVENGDTLNEAVETLSITMNEEILQVPGVETANILTLQDADGNYYGDGCTSVDGTSASIDAAFGEAGDYVFSYTVVSADTHPVSGQFAFTWEPPADFEAAPAYTTEPICGEEPGETVATEDPAEPTGDAEPTNDAEATSAPEATETQNSETDAENTTDDDGVPSWVFIVVSIAAVALIVGLIIFNWMRARRMRASVIEDAVDDDLREELGDEEPRK